MRKEVLVLLAILLSSSASAEIIFGQPKSIYNVGDDFELPLTLKTIADTSNFLTADLVCSSQTIELYKSPVSIKQGEEKSFTISTSLGNFLVSGVNGQCFIQASFGDQTSQSQTFEVSPQVQVTTDIMGAVFSPGDEVKIRGKAKKLNEKDLEGFLEISIAGLGLKTTSSIVSGLFNFTFSIPENAKAGNYEAVFSAYDKDSSGVVMNSGTSSSSIKVRQVMKSLEIAFDSASIYPGKDISLTVLAYDQADDYIISEASVSIISPSGSEKKKSVVKTGNTIKFQTEQNFEPGNWKIQAISGEFTAKKEFVIEEVKKIDFTLENNTFTVKNIGNVPFNGFVEVFIGEKNEIKQIENLPVDGTKAFKLAAPNGQYSIEVSDGNQKVGLGTTLLTGRAVSVNEVGASFRGNWLILFWTLLIIALLIGVIFAYRRIAKKKFIGKASGAFTPQKSSDASNKTAVAVASGVLNKGQKQECAIISIYIKNLQDLEAQKSDGLKTIDSAIWQAKDKGAKIYSEGSFKIAVLTPSNAKDSNIYVDGVRIAEQVERIINEYNKRSAQKVEFGVALNFGELIHESADGKFKFVSPDNSLGQAKKLSMFSNKEVILSEKAHAKTVGKIKTAKLQDRDLWKLEKIVDRTAHVDFINKFKQDNKKFKL